MTDITPSPAAEAADPSTSQARLAELAQSHPELRATIALNPACYPGLLDWIESVGDEEAQRAVATARSAAAPVPARVDPFAAPVTAAVAPAARTAAPRPAREGRSRAPLFIGIAAGLVLLLVGGGVVYSLVVSRFGGASSPEAAVQKMFDGLASFDVAAMYSVLSPAELGSFSASIDELRGVPADDDTPDYAALIAEVQAVTELTITDVEYEAEEVARGIAKVTITDGEFFMDTDSEVMAHALAVAAAKNLAGQALTGTSSEGSDDAVDYLEDAYEDMLDDALPLEFDADDVEDTLGFQFTLMAVQEGNAWYVSPLLSYLEFAREYVNISGDWDLGDLPDDSDVARFASPEEAVEGVLDGIESLVDDGDIDGLVAALPLPERRALALYGEPLTDLIGDRGWGFSWSDLELTVEANGSTALLELESLTVDTDDGYNPATIEFDGVCADWEARYSEDRVCLDDVNALDELGIAEARIVAVQENGGWLVSPLQTAGFISSIIAKRYAELAKDGDLDKLEK